MKQILVSGSTARDTHMYFPENFESFFSEGNLSQRVNFSSVSKWFDQYRGGTGANITYSLCLLGECPILLSSVGKKYDFHDILREKANLKYIHTSPDLSTAQTTIIHDTVGNKMEFFHPGAIEEMNQLKIEQIEESIGVWVVSAWDIATMLDHARKLREKEVLVLLDPSQQISQMSQDELREFLSFWNFLIVNHYELTEIIQKSFYEEAELRNMFDAFIVTYGSRGSDLFVKDETIHIPAQNIQEDDVDSTGAGDAYRAGLLYGIIESWDLKTACQLGTLLASYCVLTPGAQNHHVSMGNLMEDMKECFWVDIDLYTKRKY
jgi:adenosine kinase